MDRDHVAKVIIETTQVMADGYKRNVPEKYAEVSEDISTAISNAGVFILMEFGFSLDEIKKLIQEFHKTERTT